MERKAKLGIMGWHGDEWHDVLIVEELPTEYRIEATEAITLGTGNRTWLAAGKTALVPKHTVRFTK